MSLYFMMEKIITFPFVFKKLQSWERLEKHVNKYDAYDCVINCLYFLNIIDEEQAKDLAQKANTGIISNLIDPELKDNNIVRGTTPSVIVDKVIAKYIKHFLKEQRQKISIKLDVPKNNVFLEEILKNDESTILAFNKHNQVGHAVIAFKFDNLIHIFDPQQEIIVLNERTTTQCLSKLFEKMGVSSSARSKTNVDVEQMIEKYNNTNPNVFVYEKPTHIWINENDFFNYQIMFLEENKKIILDEIRNPENIIRKRKDLSPRTKKRRINNSSNTLSKTEQKNSHSSLSKSQSDKMDTSSFRVSQSDDMDTS